MAADRNLLRERDEILRLTRALSPKAAVLTELSGGISDVCADERFAFVQRQICR